MTSLWNEAAAHTPREARFVCVSYGLVPPNLPISLGILHWLCGDHAIAPTSLMESWGINYINHMDHIPLPDLIKMRQSLKQLNLPAFLACAEALQGEKPSDICPRTDKTDMWLESFFQTSKPFYSIPDWYQQCRIRSRQSDQLAKKNKTIDGCHATAKFDFWSLFSDK